MTDPTKPTKPKGKHELVATVPVSPDWADLQGAEREAAVRNLSKAIFAAIIEMTPENDWPDAAREVAGLLPQRPSTPGESEVRHD